MTGPASGVPPPLLRRQWEHVARRIRASGRVALFLDLDGTLAPLAPRPEKARLPDATRRVLLRLARQPRATIVVISGRRRATLRRLVAIPGIQYWGLYGAETEGAFRLSRGERLALRQASGQLAQQFFAETRAWVENKGASLSVHLREVPDAMQLAVRHGLRLLVHPLRRKLRLLENLRDADILPRRVGGKGEAVRRYLARRKSGRLLAIYCGDDYSDEPAFAAVRGGVGILVGPERPSRASYRLCRPQELAGMLADVEAALQ